MENTSGANSISRLEAKEILRYLDAAQCDPEVVAKLVQISGTQHQQSERAALEQLRSVPAYRTPAGESLHIHDAPPPKRVLQIRPQEIPTHGDPLDPVPEPIYLVWDELSKKEQQIYGLQPDGSYDEATGRAAVASVNNERRQTWLAQSKMQRHVPSLDPKDTSNAEFAPPDRPTHWKIDKVNIGERNSVGDECVSVTPEGFSICVCPRKHAYVMNNYAVPGCTMCATLGYTREDAQPEEAESERTSDDEDDELAGYDRF